MTKSRIRTALIFLTVGAAILAPRLFPHAMPTVLRYAAAAVLLALAAWMTLALLLLVAFWVVLLIRSRKTIREAPASNSIQVLDGFLREDLKAYDRQYSIVRQIHGDDIAGRLTREQIEAEYDRYDRAETAASEERCQDCDPDRVPADLLVEAWNEQPGHERHIGEWLLCISHAEYKIRCLRSTGATVVSEPMTAGYVDEFTADHYGQGGVR